MGEQKASRTGWTERRREKKRLKLQRTGDSPQNQAERQRTPSSPDQDDAGRRAGVTGNVGGTGIL